MTLCAAWIRHTPAGDQELLFATDSCLSAGERWEAGVKLFELPRRDCFISFAGDTSRAYPMILNLIQTLNASPTLSNPQTDLLDLLRHTKALFTDLAQAIDLSQLSRRDYPSARSEAQFIFGGWRWHSSEFYVWRLSYNSNSETFTEKRCFLDDSEPVCFIGDIPADELILELREEIGMESVKLDMQPLKLLINKVRNTNFSGISGAPQIGKIYRSGNSKLFGVMWQSSDGQPHYHGRPVIGIQNQVHQYFDPDTCELLSDLPDKRLDFDEYLNAEEKEFVQFCYSTDDNLKLDLNEFQRGKLQEILRQVAYKKFLNQTKIIEPLETQS